VCAGGKAARTHPTFPRSIEKILPGQHLDAEGLGGALLDTKATRNALDGFDIILVVVHAPVRAEAHTRQTAHTFLLLEAYHACLVTIQRARGANLDAVSTLGADGHAPFSVPEAGDVDGRLGRVDLFVPGLGANILTKMAANT
jgi:hypothetical protein